MTPTEQDKELRETLAKNGLPHNNVEGDLLIEIIESYCKERELRARIDELENRLRVQFIPSHWARLCAEVNSWAKYVDKRIAQLKAQQEEV